MTEAVTEADLTGRAAPATGAADLTALREGVLFLLRRLVRDPYLAEDLCNQALLIVLERLEREPLDDPGRLAAYLAQTARNLAIAERRKDARRRTSTGEEAAIEGYADPGASDASGPLQARARSRAIRQVLEELPSPRDREILVRHYLRDEDRDTLCRDLGLTEEHFHRVIHRARERFRALLGRRYAEQDLLCLAVL